MHNRSLSFLPTCMKLGITLLVFVGLVCFAMAGEAEREVLVSGRVVCVDETGSEVPCHSDDRLFALKAADGRRHLFIPEDSNSRIFEDKRLHARELQVRAWNRGQNRLEIIKVYSIKNGQLFTIHYFCSTCNIKAFVGGLCWCCQEEFEFRETPVRHEVSGRERFFSR